MEPIRVVELFAGIGAQHQALKQAQIPHEVVAISEIDQGAVRAYEAIHGPTNNLGDITKVEHLPDCDLLTYSFPCQDLSVAGKRKGMSKGSGTRSGLLWEVERLLADMRDRELSIRQGQACLFRRRHSTYINYQGGGRMSDRRGTHMRFRDNTEKGWSEGYDGDGTSTITNQTYYNGTYVIIRPNRFFLMQIYSHNKSSTRPAKILKGLNGSMYNTDITESTTEEGTSYDFTTYLFDNQEYDLLSVGILPPGATWDDKLREIERSFLYDEADKYISKYTTDVQDEEMRNKWIAYKSAIRNTPTQSDYPAEVTYPTRPE